MQHLALRRVALLAALAPATLAAGPQPASPSGEERPPVTVFFADGSSQPVRAWSFVYEYQTWPKGESPTRGSVATRETFDLLVGKKAVPTAGSTVLVEYAGTSARELQVTDSDGKRTRLRVEPPAAESLVPRLGKETVLQTRVLDLRGETLTGGKRSYCLLTYTSLVECAAADSERVVKIQFP
jgi:hypothetical protein